VLWQGIPAHTYLNPFFGAIQDWCRDKANKALKSTQHQRTIHVQIPGRQLMLLLAQSDEDLKVSVANGVLTVTLNEPSFLDTLLGRSVSKYDFRELGLGYVELHGPFTFKWEMIISEQEYGAVEGRLTTTVGGWTVTDRMGSEPIKQCIDPQVLKKRRTNQSAAAAAGKGKDDSVVKTSGELTKKAHRRVRHGKENTAPSKSNSCESLAAVAAGACWSDKDSLVAGVVPDLSDEDNVGALEEEAEVRLAEEHKPRGAQSAAQDQKGRAMSSASDPFAFD